MISAATTLTSGMIGESSDEDGLGRAGVLIYFDFQVLQVELLASDQLDVEHTTFATAKNRRIDISAPTIAAALSNDRSVGVLHLRGPDANGKARPARLRQSARRSTIRASGKANDRKESVSCAQCVASSRGGAQRRLVTVRGDVN